MSVSDDLAELVRSYLDDPEVTLTGDLGNEARTNTWGYGVRPAAVHVGEVVDALVFVADVLRTRFAGRAEAATFYAWYDSQAGQLRCSLCSALPAELPFAAAYRPVSDASAVVRLAADDPSPGVVAWDELTPVAPDDRTQPHSDPFPVWVATVC